MAALEVPGVAEFIDRESNRVYTARKKANAWTGFRPRDVKELWSRAFEQVPRLRALVPLLDAARRGDHDEMAALLRRLSLCDEVIPAPSSLRPCSDCECFW